SWRHKVTSPWYCSKSIAVEASDLSLLVERKHLSSSSAAHALDSLGRGRFARLARDGENDRAMALPQLRIRSVAYRDRETQERGSLHHVLLCLFRMFRDVSEPRPMERLGERCAEHRNAD